MTDAEFVALFGRRLDAVGLCAHSVDEMERIAEIAERGLAAEAQVAVLREALQQIASGKATSSGDLMGATWEELRHVKIARVVLAALPRGAAPRDIPEAGK